MCTPSQEQFFNALDKEPTKKAQFLRAYFILMLNPQIYDAAQTASLTKLLNVVAELGEAEKAKLVTWLADVDPERMGAIVNGQHRLLAYNIGLLLPGPNFEKVDQKAVTVTIQWVCRFLELLYKRYK